MFIYGNLLLEEAGRGWLVAELAPLSPSCGVGS